jgi:hypothetical protein
MLSRDLRRMVHIGNLFVKGDGRQWTPYEFSSSQPSHHTQRIRTLTFPHEDELSDEEQDDGEQDHEEAVCPPDDMDAADLDGEYFGAKEKRVAKTIGRTALTSVIGSREDYEDSIGNMRYE